MSTPSTATATIPPHHSHYGYSHHSVYQTNAGLHDMNSTLHGSSRLATSYASYPNLGSTSQKNSGASSQAPTHTTMSTSQSTPALSQNAKRERRPDWREFYKNGPPKEIIVIDDDSPPPTSRKDSDATNYHQPAMTSNASTEHASKKRKTGTVYDAVPTRQQASYSNTNTPHYASNTISTDRTTSLQTTAPTSLGSHGSGGSGGTYLESSTVGQKRKRVTRQQTQEEKKRKEIEVVGDAYSFYVPPPKPPIKATDVYVQPVKDVCSLTSVSYFLVIC